MAARLVFVVGTRPEIIKMAPVVLEASDRGLEFLFVHTGQHYDYEMSQVFIEQLGLPRPDHSFSLSAEKPAGQIAEMMVKLEGLIRKPRNGLMVIQGDTNTMLAAGLTAVKLGMKLGHVEAGLRSYDWRMPEEHNRRMIDHVSDLLFAPTELAARNLLEERVWGRVYVTGNTVIDAIDMYLPLVDEAEERAAELAGQPGDFALVTFHRAENVDDPHTLRSLVRVVLDAPIRVVFPVHPRTRRRLEEEGLLPRLESAGHVRLLPPVGYFEFLALERMARVILTDSGGIQEEATHPAIRKPVLVLRSSTERPEAVRAGFARVVGTHHQVVLAELERILAEPPNLPSSSPFGDGLARKRIVDVLEDHA